MTVDFFKQKYGYEIDGMWLPRVTAVTSMVSKTNFLALSRFEGFQASTDWGTLVHSAIEHLLKGEKTIIDPRIVPSVEIFKAWQKEHSLEIENPQEHIEKRVFDKENCYAGTVDLIAKVDGRLGLIDLKTGSLIREEHSLQTAAYFSAYNKSQKKSEACQTRWILRIDQYEQCRGCFAKRRTKSGRERTTQGNPSCNHQWGEIKGEIEFKELTSHEHDLNAFLSAKELWVWYNKDWLSRITNYPVKFLQKVLI